jgi:signal peptidase
MLWAVPLVSLWAVAVLGAGMVGAWQASGYRAYVVRTASMSPTLSPGDVVIDSPSAGTPAVGELVTFTSNGPDGVVTHRVHEVIGGEIHTKGDAIRSPDAGAVRVESIIGRVARIVPRAGYLIVYLRQPAGIASTVTLGAMVVLAWGLFFDDRSARSKGARAA